MGRESVLLILGPCTRQSQQQCQSVQPRVPEGFRRAQRLTDNWGLGLRASFDVSTFGVGSTSGPALQFRHGPCPLPRASPRRTDSAGIGDGPAPHRAVHAVGGTRALPESGAALRPCRMPGTGLGLADRERSHRLPLRGSGVQPSRRSLRVPGPVIPWVCKRLNSHVR